MAIEDSLALIEQRLANVQPPDVEELAIQAGVPVSRFVEGLSNEMELRGELEALGYRGLKVERYVLAAQLRRDLEVYRSRLAIWKKRREAEQITEGEFRTLLERMGAEPEAIELEVALLTPKKPAAAIQSSEVTLAILDIELVPARPALAPTEITLAIVAAEEVAEVPVVMIPTEITLAIVAAEEVAAPPALAPVGISLEVIELEEV